MTIEISLLISGIFIALAIFFGIYSVKQSRKDSAEKETIQLTSILVKLETINQLILNLTSEISYIREDLINIRKRISQLEISLDAAHRRIDNVDEKLNKEVKN